jgi:hypothetical protein
MMSLMHDHRPVRFYCLLTNATDVLVCVYKLCNVHTMTKWPCICLYLLIYVLNKANTIEAVTTLHILFSFAVAWPHANKAKQNKWQTVKPDLHWHSPNWINWGSLFTPGPAPVLAATSTLYRIPGTREGMTTEKVEPSTVLFIWYLVSLPRHQTCKKYTMKVKLVNDLSWFKDQHKTEMGFRLT